MPRRGLNRGRGGGGRGVKVSNFASFAPGGVVQPFGEQSDNREYSDLYGQPQHQLHPHQHYHQQQISGRYAEDYFPQDIPQYHGDQIKHEPSVSQIQRRLPASAASAENAGAKSQTKDMSWEKVRKMNLYRLRTLPLDMVHVLDEGRKRRLRVAPLEGQQRKIEAVEGLGDPAFVSKCLEPLELRCDCCAVDFVGSNKLRDMLNHIQTQQHFVTFRARMIEDPLYAYRMNKTAVIPPQPTPPQNMANAKKKNKNQPQPSEQAVAPSGQTKRNQSALSAAGEDTPKAYKKMKHADIPEEYRPMADWLACYVCNITCSSLSIYESHAVGKRHQRILSLAPQHVQALPWGPYLIDGKPTIDTTLGAVKISVQGRQNIRVGGEQAQLLGAPWLDKVRGFVASKISSKMEI